MSHRSHPSSYGEALNGDSIQRSRPGVTPRDLTNRLLARTSPAARSCVQDGAETAEAVDVEAKVVSRPGPLAQSEEPDTDLGATRGPPHSI